MIKKILYYVSWIFKCYFLNKKIPLTSSIIITDKCNLHCRHCCVSNLGYHNFSYDKITKQIKKLYSFGARILVISGGEPFVWHSKNKTVEDIVLFAKRIGFFRVVICTNGTFDLSSSADYLWVSMDGSEKTHNKIRGSIFNKVWENINNSSHKNIFLNYTISKYNFKSFYVDFKNIIENRKIKGVLFHFFTPYIGTDSSLLLNNKEKHIALRTLLKLKKRHPIKISNTFDGIKLLLSNQWKRPIWSSILICDDIISECCCRKGIYNIMICSICGCTPSVETYVIQKLKPLAIIENLKFL
ncbi:MAG TPA: radical SAM protein [Spirochaetota bacterium]|nr:radical SAM protein [Spirochaetota bacterium]HOH37729.1 radical SAM protein [Spirochaetota bacterium]HPJ13459.1 radical SAM protein [Spirochaetota bacterium]HPM32978.1 radical SAM protein [Spirochaetota bacterium]HPY03899.1 radical SAM protein [Spirochaetota bacterium]